MTKCLRSHLIEMRTMVVQIGVPTLGIPDLSVVLNSNQNHFLFHFQAGQFSKSFGDTDAPLRVDFHLLLSQFSSACKTIDYAHAQNVLHRDLKPDNILVKAPGQYVLCDLGCSRKMEGNLTGSRSYNVLKVSCNTKGGGTPEYSSPDMILDS